MFWGGGGGGGAFVLKPECRGIDQVRQMKKITYADIIIYMYLR